MGGIYIGWLKPLAYLLALLRKSNPGRTCLVHYFQFFKKLKQAQIFVAPAFVQA